MADEKARQKRALDESMLASASIDGTPQVGLVVSSFTGGTEHDGSPVKGLASPRPTNIELPDVEMRALVDRSLDLQHPGRRSIAIGPEDWVLLKIVVTPEIATDVRVVRALMDRLIRGRQGKRFTIAEDAPAPAGYAGMIADLAANNRRLRIEYVNLAEAPCLASPAIRRTYAANNPHGVYTLPKLFREVDKVVTVGPLRTHPMTGAALSAASYWSFAPCSAYGPRREKLLALGNPSDVLTDLYMHHPPDFALLGGSSHTEGDGQDPLRHNIMIAGRNALAVDTIGAAVMGFDPRKLPLFDKLEARGFGICDPDSIWTHGNEIEQARRAFRRPAGWSSL